MPIDKTMSDAMLGTFRTMLSDCRSKGYSGEAFDQMCTIMGDMELLAQTMDDMTAFSTKLTTGGYFMNFSTQYGRVLSEAATSSHSQTTPVYNDAALLQQTLKSYEEAILSFANHRDKATLTKAIQDVVGLGKSGVTYPTFLRLIIEQGLDKAIEGTVVNRKYLLENVVFSDNLIHPPTQRRDKAILAKYDEMAATAAFNVPNSVVFTLEQSQIISDNEVDLRRYEQVQDLWFRLIMDLHKWVDAYTRNAPTDDRYAGANALETRQNIEEAKNCLPGKIKIYKKHLKDNFQMAWEDIFTHESFIAETTTNRFPFASNYIEFLRNDAYPQCIPLRHADGGLIAKAEALYGKSMPQ